MSIIDRAALAASGAYGYAPSLVDDPERIKSLGPDELSGDDWRNVVRAVLQTIRSAGDELLAKACENDRVIAWGDYDAFWPAMIDVILAESIPDQPIGPMTFHRIGTLASPHVMTARALRDYLDAVIAVSEPTAESPEASIEMAGGFFVTFTTTRKAPQP